MAKYRKKPVIVDAFQWTGDRNQTEDPEWFIECLKSGVAKVCKDAEEVHVYADDALETIITDVWVEIETLEGTMRAERGDYIVKGIEGEVYPVKPDIFKKSYEKA